MVSSFQVSHWNFTKFPLILEGKPFVVINTYMLSIPLERPGCWNSIQRLHDHGDPMDNILAGDFNAIRNNTKKMGGFYCRDPSHDRMEDIILD